MRDSNALRKSAYHIMADKRRLEDWLHDTANILYSIYMVGNQGEDVRSACMDAVNALDWLRKPVEQVEIVYRKPPYKRRDDKPPTMGT